MQRRDVRSSPTGSLIVRRAGDLLTPPAGPSNKRPQTHVRNLVSCKKSTKSHYFADLPEHTSTSTSASTSTHTTQHTSHVATFEKNPHKHKNKMEDASPPTKKPHPEAGSHTPVPRVAPCLAGGFATLPLLPLATSSSSSSSANAKNCSSETLVPILAITKETFKAPKTTDCHQNMHEVPHNPEIKELEWYVALSPLFSFIFLLSSSFCLLSFGPSGLSSKSLPSFLPRTHSLTPPLWKTKVLSVAALCKTRT